MVHKIPSLATLGILEWRAFLARHACAQYMHVLGIMNNLPALPSTGHGHCTLGGTFLTKN